MSSWISDVWGIAGKKIIFKNFSWNVNAIDTSFWPIFRWIKIHQLSTMNIKFKKFKTAFQFFRWNISFYIRYHSRRNEIFSIRWMVSFLQLFKWSTPKWPSLRCYLRSFWQKWNIISGDKCYLNTTSKRIHPKGNICACEYFIQAKILDQNKTFDLDFVSFRPQWNLI